MQGQATKAKAPVDWIALAGAAITVVLWASAFAGIRAGLQSYSPESVALLRYLTASAVLAGLAIAQKTPLPAREDVPGIALMGFIGFTVYNVALNGGEVSISAGVASFIVASAPIYMVIMARVFFAERLSRAGWVGILVSFGGVAIIALATDEGLEINPRALLVLLAAVTQATYFIGQRRYLKRYGPLRFTMYAIWAGTAFLLVYTPGLVAEFPTATASATWAIIYMGVLPGALAYASWSLVLNRVSASVAGSFLYLVPAFAVVIAWVWLGEVPNLMALLGGGLIVVGVIIVNRLGKV